MSTPLTRQDLIAITDGAKNKIISQLVSRRDMLGATDNARDRILNTISTFHVENQTLLRQVNGQHDQMGRRVTNVESQINTIRQELRMLTQAVNRLYEVEAQKLQQLRASAAAEQQRDQLY